MTRMLLIDTCTEHGLMVLAEDGAVRHVGRLPVGFQNSATLFPKIEEGLKDLAWTAADLEVLAATVGPGSYTGIRVGAAVAKALAYARRLPLVGVSSLVAYVPDADGDFAAVIDAKIGGAYIQRGQRMGEQVNWMGEPELVPLEGALSHLGAIRRLVGPNFLALRLRMEKAFPGEDWIWDERAPSEYSLLTEAMKCFDAGKYTTDGELPLMYLRRTQAEIERDAKAQDKA